MRIVSLSKKPYLLLSYLIEVFSSSDAFTGRIFYLEEPRATESERLADLAAKLRAVSGAGPTSCDLIVLDRSTEVGWISDARAAAITHFCKETRFPISRFIYASQDRRTPDKLQQVFRKCGTPPPRWIWFHHYLADLEDAHKQTLHGDHNFQALYRADPRFLFLNRKVRPHRLALGAYTLSRQFLADRAILSFNAERTKIFDIDKACAEIDQVLPSFSSIARTHRDDLIRINPIIEGGSPVRTLPESAVNRALTCLVAESEYRGAKRFTEKSIKPMIYYRPYLVAGSAGTLDEIRKLGFVTFSSLIDERYDSEPNHDRRMMMVMKELERLLEWTADPDRRRYFLDAMRPRLITNQLHFQNSIKRELLERLAGDLNPIIGGA